MFYGGGRMYRGGYGMETFDEQYHCFSGAFSDKPQLEEGDKILLPSSAFEQLARLQVEYPMLFEIRSSKGGRTHCGVMEFTAPEGQCIMPFWIMQNLLCEEGALISVKNVSLPKASFVKFKPQSVDFLDISNPRAVLERQLRTFSCVTVGDQICLPYNDKRYYLEVQEVKPADAACIIETDCNVDFDAPVGYQEPTRRPSTAGSASSGGGIEAPEPIKARQSDDENAPSFKPFTGSGQRLDGKALKQNQAAMIDDTPLQASNSVPTQPAIPAFASAGRTASGNMSKNPAALLPPKPSAKFKPPTSKWAKTNKVAFTGSGHTLK
uniref:Ubiquitin fusion degradation protein n=1 Tax=Aureoumbra lagunensis TaxID=44058 RepID=A0A7S3K3U4_9STRA|mmetsp:Transcript_17954/g.23391  ORF Transcript_17954/g.23391 Transcript_17954/m.23391 type:complete len:323 (+) Transcript_17954:108-1076(+)